jgi:hypothetical protein
MKSNIWKFLFIYQAVGTRNEAMSEKKGEPFVRLFFELLVGADGLEPPTYAV